MGQRLKLQDCLRDILGSNNVYFQPPPDVQMKYPCIVYTIDFLHTSFADDLPYKHKKRYLVTHIDQNPDSKIPDEIAKLPTCVFDRFFTADQLNHNVFRLFF